MKRYKVIGLMSGTSLDGLDIAYCTFNYDQNWKFEIVHTDTIEYPSEWLKKLKNLITADGTTIKQTNIEYGRYLGDVTYTFIQSNNLKPDFISSHGHTIFHQPEKGYTLQIGDGKTISEVVGLPVIYDFRTKDVQLGGQGAPLVPIGDRLLFPNYNYCLNLGGIANISYEENNQRIAFDICPCNQVLNLLAQETGLEFDENGLLASQGNVNKSLLEELNGLKYYTQTSPKSLGREWIETTFIPILTKTKKPINDKLTTCSEHFAIQIAKFLGSGKNVLITGGGAFNTYLIERIKSLSKADIHIPDKILINYKEAMIFAFLGILRWRNEINCLSTVTGASRDSSSGVIIK